MDKYSHLRAKMKCMLRERCDKYLGSVESDFKSNPKRFLSLLRQNSKSHSVPHRISMASGPSRTSGRIKAEGPNAIASLVNRYFASVFTESSPEFEELNEIYDSNQTALTELSLTNDEVRAVLLSLDYPRQRDRMGSRQGCSEKLQMSLHHHYAACLTSRLVLGLSLLSRNWQMLYWYTKRGTVNIQRIIDLFLYCR